MPCVVTRCLAKSPPRPPVPPVMRAVPLGSSPCWPPACTSAVPPVPCGLLSAWRRRSPPSWPSAAAAEGDPPLPVTGGCAPGPPDGWSVRPTGEEPSARASRGTRSSPPRTAICGSPVARAGASSDRSSASTRTKRSGCSDCTARIRPHTGAAARPATASSPAPVATAPRVTNARRASSSRSSARNACTSRSARRAASRAVSDDGTDATIHSGAVSKAGSSSPSASTHATPAPSATGTVGHSTTNSASGPAACGASRALSTGRSVSAPTVATGSPAASASSMATVSVPPAGEIRTRSAVAPAAYSAMSLQAKGRRIRSGSAGSAASRTSGCRTASKSAGCSPKFPAASACSAGSRTSA